MNGNVASLEAIKSGDLEKEFARVGRLYRNVFFLIFWWEIQKHMFDHFRKEVLLISTFTRMLFSAIVRLSTNTWQTPVVILNHFRSHPNFALLLLINVHFICWCRLHKYWLIGEKAGNLEAFAILPGYPDNVRTNEKGEFWVAIHCRRSLYSHLMSLYPKIRHFLLKLPISAKTHYLIHIGGRLHAMAVKYSPEGKILQVLEDSKGKVVKAISEVEEKDGKLWMGSVLMPFVAVYDLSWGRSTSIYD